MSLQLRGLLRGFHLCFSRKKIRRVGGVVGIHTLLPIFRGYTNLYKRKCPKHLCSLCVAGTATPPPPYPSFLSFSLFFFHLTFPSILSPYHHLPSSYSPSPHKHTFFFSLPILEIKFPSQLPGREGNGKRTQQGCDNVNRKTSHSRSLPPALRRTALSCLTPSHLRNLKQLKTM